MGEEIRAQCEKCGKTLKCPASMAGKTGKCPSCGGPITVSGPVAAASGEQADELAASSGPRKSTLQRRAIAGGIGLTVLLVALLARLSGRAGVSDESIISIAQEVVRSQLKAPSTAVFSSSKDEYTIAQITDARGPCEKSKLLSDNQRRALEGDDYGRKEFERMARKSPTVSARLLYMMATVDEARAVFLRNTVEFDVSDNDGAILATTHLLEKKPELVLTQGEIAQLKAVATVTTSPTWKSFPGEWWMVEGWVDAQNSYGATLRNHWTACVNVESGEGLAWFPDSR